MKDHKFNLNKILGVSVTLYQYLYKILNIRYIIIDSIPAGNRTLIYEVKTHCPNR